MNIDTCEGKPRSAEVGNKFTASDNYVPNNRHRTYAQKKGINGIYLLYKRTSALNNVVTARVMNTSGKTAGITKN
jgi:hypothetical protein